MSREHEKEELIRRLRELEKEETAATYAETAPRNKGFAFPGKAVKWIVLAIAFIGLAFILSKSSSLLNFIPGFGSADQKAVFVERLQETEELVTAEAYTKVVIKAKDSEVFGIKLPSTLTLPGTEREILIIFPGVVRAGIDLSQLTEEDINLNDENKTAVITVPKPHVLGLATIDMSKVQTFSSKGLFRDNLGLDETFEKSEEAQKLMVEEAKKQGLLDLAEENAEVVLKGMFGLMEYDITIEFEE